MHASVPWLIWEQEQAGCATDAIETAACELLKVSGICNFESADSTSLVSAGE